MNARKLLPQAEYTPYRTNAEYLLTDLGRTHTLRIVIDNGPVYRKYVFQTISESLAIPGDSPAVSYFFLLSSIHPKVYLLQGV